MKEIHIDAYKNEDGSYKVKVIGTDSKINNNIMKYGEIQEFVDINMEIPAANIVIEVLDPDPQKIERELYKITTKK